MTDNTSPRRLAAIDIGSSAIKFAVYEIASNAAPRLIHEANPVTTSLGKGLVAGAPLRDPARSLTLETLRDFRRQIAAMDAGVGVCVATQAVRIASDREAFIREVKEIFGEGAPVRVISNADEARLSWISAHASLGPFLWPMINLDPGGSSNDFAFGTGPEPGGYVSLEFGMNHLTDLVDPEETAGVIDRSGVARLSDYLAGHYAAVEEALRDRPAIRGFIATSGAIIAIANVADGVRATSRHERSMAAHGRLIDRQTLDRVIEETAPLTSDERRRRHPCLSASRAPIFIHGCLVYRTLIKILDVPGVLTNGFGLKFGALIDALGSRGRA